MQTRGGRKSKISKLGGRHICIISIISTNASRYEDIIGTASSDIAPEVDDNAAAMLLFDMRNVSSNSMIPASVAETMTDIVLQKMRESTSIPIRVVIAPILEDDNGIVGDGVLSSNPNDHAVVVLDRDGIQRCCH